MLGIQNLIIEILRNLEVHNTIKLKYFLTGLTLILSLGTKSID